MRLLGLGLFLAFAACSGNAAETPLRCDDCPAVQVVRIIDGDTLDTSSGHVCHFEVGTPERGQRRATNPRNACGNLRVTLSVWKMGRCILRRANHEPPGLLLKPAHPIVIKS